MTKYIFRKILVGIALAWLKYREGELEGYTEENWYFYPSEDFGLMPEVIDMVDRRVVITFNVQEY